MEDYLQKYILKRNFKKTPEPRGTFNEEMESSSFVVHRHDARNLHYDLRIAFNGKLVCWAVPKGFSYDPSVKHLAVHTEDHPIQYISFEGIIPKGEYGAGSMNIWDIGTYKLMKEDNIGAGILKGELKLKFSGRKLRGEWHLVKLKKGKDEWLLFKAKDAYQEKTWDSLLTLDLSKQPEADMPDRIVPMTYKTITQPFTDPEWGFEILHEGLRMICIKNGHVFNFIKDGGIIDDNVFLIEQLSFINEIAPERAVFDGIMVSIDENGLSSINILKQIIKDGAPSSNLYYYMLDMPNFEGYDISALPYDKRKMLLSFISGKNPRLHNVDYLKGNGDLFSEEAKKAGISAVLAKKLDSPYEQGESEHWKLIDLTKFDISGKSESTRYIIPEPVAAQITHPEKVFFPELSLTKKDLVYYYNDVAELVLPYLKDRPIHILRFPDGIYSSSFYQKHLPGEITDNFEFITLPDKEGEPPYFICKNKPGLLHLINLGSIDLHIWFSRKESLQYPDWIAWDLDPKQALFFDVIKVAKEIGKILHGIGLASFAKTSGKSGLHILVPIQPHYTYEQTRMFSESIARIVANENKSIATVERNIESRGDRVYIDYLQNRRGQTLVVPYAVRPVPEASVSMPLEWEELDKNLSIDMFTMKNAMERISRKGDILQPVLSTKQTLDTAIQKLDAFVKNITLSGK
jgi:bifunctional non-homologous end joining protein LigD